jgi:Transglycosylase SLT domain/Putative peptidoglycan binding domain
MKNMTPKGDSLRATRVETVGHDFEGATPEPWRAKPLGNAWTGYYQRGLDYRSTPTVPRAYGIMALKNESIYNGYSYGVDPKLAFFGLEFENQVKLFQKAAGLEADGVIGPLTAGALIKQRVALTESKFGIPDQLLLKQIKLESGNDPGATGSVDPRDRGLLQINSHWHPEVSDAQAFDPAFSIPWGGQNLKSTYVAMGDWDGALAAHNIGQYYATKWLEAGKPASGLTWKNADGTTTDYAQLATRYVSLVRSQRV